MAAELSSSRRSAGTAIVLLVGIVTILEIGEHRWYKLIRDHAVYLGFVVLLFTALPGWRIAGFALYALAFNLFDLVLVALFGDLGDHQEYLTIALWAVIVGSSVQSLLWLLRRWNAPKINSLDLLLMMLFMVLLVNKPSSLKFQGYRDGFEITLVTVAVLFLFALWRLKRHAYELWVSSWIRILYKIRSTETRSPLIPSTGPVLVIANHACWWDPLFLAGIIQRPITPMMTSGFYDIWHLKPFMKYVIEAIRVEDRPMRHETPELKEAVAALDRGECVVIFPEGLLRRKEEVPLHRFGRGVHQILKDRPNTPVVSCWVEGGWGSWCSWRYGPPTKNKKFDIRRRIDIGVSPPIMVPAEVLENHFATRVFLMNAVSAARKHLGLEPLPEFTMPAKSDEPEPGPT